MHSETMFPKDMPDNIAGLYNIFLYFLPDDTVSEFLLRQISGAESKWFFEIYWIRWLCVINRPHFMRVFNQPIRLCITTIKNTFSLQICIEQKPHTPDTEQQRVTAPQKQESATPLQEARFRYRFLHDPIRAFTTGVFVFLCQKIKHSLHDFKFTGKILHS